MNIKRKILSGILIFALIFGQLSAPITVLAQEATQSAQLAEPSPEPTPEATNSATPTDPTPTPSPAPSAEPTPTSQESTPSAQANDEKDGPQRNSNKKLKLRDEKAQKNRVKSKHGNYAEGEVLVKFRKDTSDAKIDQLEDKHDVQVVEEIKQSNIAVIESDKSTESLVAQLKKEPIVEVVEPNYVYHLTGIPNDPKFNELWGLHNSGQTVNGKEGVNDADIDAPEAWDLEKAEQPDVVVAVLDTGVAYDHPDLTANMWSGTSCKDHTGNQIAGGCPHHGWDVDNNDNDPYDNYGHGTHVSGTIAAAANDGKGMAGTSMHNNIKIMAVKVSLSGSQQIYTDSVIKGINFAKNNGARVINASFGDGIYSQLMKDAIDAFPGLFIAAAGNSTSNNDLEPQYPSGFNSANIIAVAATDQNDNLASFSSYGASSVDIGAPGVNILSTLPEQNTEYAYEEKDFQHFQDVTPPNIPIGYTKTGDFGTKVLTSSGNVSGGELGTVLYGDVANIPYKNNAHSIFTSPKFNLSGYEGGLMSFVSRCDTEYKFAYTDYMQLEVSKDGENFEYLDKWDEMDLDALNGSNNPTGYAEAYLEIYIPKQYITQDFKYRLIWHTDGSEAGDLGLGCFVDNIAIFGGEKVGGGAYDYWGGTSMATPHVVGEAAMIMSYKPNLTISQVKDVILNTGDPLLALAGKTVSGKRINLNNALRSATQSSNANLSNLTVSTGTLVPNFSPSILSYTVSVGDNISQITVTPTAQDTKSTIKVNNVTVASGSNSQPINLNPGSNIVTVLVTAEDSSTKTYTINVIRANDITAPTITITKSPNKNIHNGSYTITINFDDAVTKKYKLDSGNLNDYTNPVTVSSEGQHTVYAEGIDSAGNKSTAQVTIEIDTTAPQVIITKTPNKDISNSSYTLGVNYSDASIKEYRINNGNWNQYIGDVTITSEGNYTFEARGTDLAGNQTTAQTTFTIDTVKPVLTITSPAVNARVSGISILQFTVNEQAEVKCSLDNHVFKKCSSGDNFASLDLFNNFIDGPLTLYIQAEDPASNIGTTDRGFIKDTYIPLPPSAPTAEAGPLINNQEYSFGFTVDARLPNDVKPNHLIKIYLNTNHEFISDTITQNHINAQKYTFVVSKDSLGEDGAKIFTARIIDHLGRLSPLSNPLTLTLDTKSAAPTITSVAADNKINALEQNQVEVKGQTEAQSLVKISLTDQISTKSATIKLSGSQTNYSISLDAKDLNDGIITVSAQAEDEAGNSSGENLLTVIKDTKAPTLNSVSIFSNNPKPALAKIGDAITLTFSSSENLENVAVSINGLSPTISQIGINLYKASRLISADDPEGEVTFNIAYTDSVGNLGEMVTISSDNSKVVVDKIKPVLQQITAITSPTNINSPDYIFSSTEAGSITYQGGCFSSKTVAQAGNNIITFNTLTDGTYDNCTITVVDEASNVSSSLKVNTFTVDTVAPTSNLEINNGNKYTNSKQLNLTLTNASVDIAKVEIAEGATGSFGNPVTYSPSLSYTLQDSAEGQKVIRVRLTDAASNVSEEITGTIILDTSPPTISNLTLTNQTTGNHLFVKNGDILELSATIADTNLVDILSSDIKADLFSVGGQAQTNPSSFDQATGKATWSNIVVSSTSEGFIKISVDAKDQADNAATTVTKTIEADNSIPQAKADYFTTTKNTPILISSALVLANDTDSSGDILQVLQGADFIFTPQADFIGTTTLSYTITDGANFATGTIYITITPALSENEKALQPVTELGEQDNKVVVVAVPFESTINVSAGSTNAILDLSNVVSLNGTEKNAALTGKININVATKDLGNLSLQLPETVTISGPVSWNGSIKVPTILDNSTFKINSSITTALIEVGSEDTKLILSKAARLVIPGKKGHLAAYIQAGKVISITTICASDNQASGDTLPKDGECKIDVGSDLAIWTKHFTRFVTYTETPQSAPAPSGGGSSTVCTDAKPGSAPKLLSAKASEPNEVTLSWSKASDPVTYYLVAYGLQKGQVQFGNPNVGGKDTTIYTVKGLSGGTTYYFKVRAGNHCMSGDYSNEIAVKAYGGKILKSAAGFKKGVLSTSKDKQKIQSPAPSGAQPASNVLNVIKDFLLRLLSDLQSLSYLPILRPTHPGSG